MQPIPAEPTQARIDDLLAEHEPDLVAAAVGVTPEMLEILRTPGFVRFCSPSTAVAVSTAGGLLARWGAGA
jgi:hypothetical protein